MYLKCTGEVFGNDVSWVDRKVSSTMLMRFKTAKKLQGIGGNEAGLEKKCNFEK